MASVQNKAKTAAKPAAKPAPVKAAVKRPAVVAPIVPPAAKPLPKQAVAKAAPQKATAAAAPIPNRVKAAIKTPPVTPKPAPVESPSPKISSPIAQEEKTMNASSSYSGFQDVIAEAQDKAKAAFEKSSSAMGEVGEFTRGNVEALVESGKILASGLQDFGSNVATESRSVFETLTADLKELAAAKTPADFLKIQSELVRKSFDGAVAYGSKNSEAVLKLATDTFAPISGRVSLAVEKARTTTSL